MFPFLRGFFNLWHNKRLYYIMLFSGSRSTAARAGKQCLQSGGKDGTKSEAARQAGQRALQRLTSLPRAASSYIASLRRQRAQRSSRLGLGESAFGGSLPLWKSLELNLKSAYAREARRQPSMCFYTAITHRSEHGAEERSSGSSHLSQRP
jgi:hypothetical protein